LVPIEHETKIVKVKVKVRNIKDKVSSVLKAMVKIAIGPMRLKVKVRIFRTTKITPVKARPKVIKITKDREMGIT